MGVMTSHGDAAGLPVIDRESCSVCGVCVEACPVGVLSKGPTGIEVDNTVGFGCIACAHCMMVCPSESIAVAGRDLKPEDVEALPTGSLRASPEQLEALFRSRRSIRKFKTEAVPNDMLDRVISAATTAPMGIPPWEVGIVAFRDQAKVRELAVDTARGWEMMLKFMDRGLMRFFMRLFMKRESHERFVKFVIPLGREIVEGKAQGMDRVLYDAPAALLFSHSPHADSADAVIACTYAMVEAEALGLGTCMIGCLPPVLARRKDLLKKFGVPEGQKPAIVLILGYSAEGFRRGVRRRFLTVSDY
jgi:nitroreductase/NAD-dependent dihydropyrimidine dehydrogenase PreA subunit